MNTALKANGITAKLEKIHPVYLSNEPWKSINQSINQSQWLSSRATSRL